MQSVQSSLTIIGAESSDRKVFWNGQEIPCIGIHLDSDGKRQRVIIEIEEDPVYTEMKEAGIIVRRVSK